MDCLVHTRRSGALLTTFMNDFVCTNDVCSFSGWWAMHVPNLPVTYLVPGTGIS